MITKKRIFPIALVFVLLISTSAMTSAKEIIVGNGSDANFRSIQEAVSDSHPGDTVVVRPGTYKENIVINVASLTIRPESKSAEVLVEFLNRSESTFHIKADNVTITGFKIVGSGETFEDLSSPSGICLEDVDNCTIMDNTFLKNSSGVSLLSSNFNNISKNLFFINATSQEEEIMNAISLEDVSAMNNLTGNIIENGYIELGAHSSNNSIFENEILNGEGIVIDCCGAGNLISNNTIFNCSSGVSVYAQGINISNNMIKDCSRGIDLSFAIGTEIYGNMISNCSVGINLGESCSGIELFDNIIISSSEYGIFIPDFEGSEKIYNNYFNNTLNLRLGISGGNIWNTSLNSGTNIAGGPHLGGNFWAKPDGTGFSQTSTDSDGDGIIDLPYKVSGNEFDYLPLVSISSPQETLFSRVIVKAEPGFPVADFTANVTSGYAPLSVQFTDSSQNAIGWNWDFGDGATSTEQNPGHNYSLAGNYPVILTVNNENGTNSKTIVISVQEASGEDKVLPVANFTANPENGYAPLSVQFTDSSQNAIGWNWDFGDGATSTEQNPGHNYSLAGNYPVILTVNNENGTNSKTLVITVQETSGESKVLPVANFTAIPESYAPLSVQFIDSSQNVIDWYWSFGDGAASTEQNPVHNYSLSGNYAVTLIVNNENGTNSKTQVISVQEVSGENKVLPVANFTASPESGYIPLSVRFADSSQNAIGWSWNFGDGAVSIEQNPMHTYSLAGDHTVTLTVSNENGTGSKSLLISVQEASNIENILPVANFTANVTNGYAPLSVQFTDLSQYATTRGWDFNNDGTADSNDIRPVYVYTSPGTYTVNLKVSNQNGTVSKSATITVLEDSSSSGGSSSGGSSSGGSSSSGSSSSGSSGGGGGGGSPEPQNNVATKELSQAFITSGNSVRFDFPRNATSVVYIDFNSKKTAGKTTTIVEMLKGKSTLVSEPPSGEVYKSLNIWVGNGGFATSQNIENSVVCFKVEKSWMQEKSINQSSITMDRYSDKKWNKLPTSLVREDDKYFYFTAQTPGFSPFAIIGNTVAKEVITKAQPAAETKIQPGPKAENVTQNNTVLKSDKVVETKQKSEKENKEKLPVFGMICLIALLLVVFLFKADKQ